MATGTHKEIWKVQIVATAPNGQSFDSFYRIVVSDRSVLDSEIRDRASLFSDIGLAWNVGEKELVRTV